MNEEGMRILKMGECQSLSGRSTLTYSISCREDKEVYLSLVGNTGKGIFNKDWISLVLLDPLLASEEKPITSGLLRELFKGKSSNSAGFVLAVLLKEGLLKVSKDSLRCYERIDPTEFKKSIQELIESKVSLNQAPTPPPPVKKDRHKKESV